MTSKTFISGITGFVGRALATRLAERGEELVGIARGGGQVPGAQVIAGDVLDPESFAPTVHEARTVVHLAAPTTAVEINGAPLSAMKTNLLGTYNLLELFTSGQAEHFVYLSSGKVYGQSCPLPFVEDAQPRPTTPLGQSKLAAEQLIGYYAKHTGKRYTIVRLFNAYGPGQRQGFLIPTILEQISTGGIKLGDIQVRRDFIYIDDIVSALLLVLSGAGERLPGLEVFNLGSGQSHSPAEIVALLAEITGQPLPIEVDETRLRQGEPDEECSSIERLSSLGWSPRVDIKSGLERIMEGSGGEPIK